MKCKPKDTAVLWDTNMRVGLNPAQQWNFQIYYSYYEVWRKNFAMRMSKSDFDKYFEVVEE